MSKYRPAASVQELMKRCIGEGLKVISRRGEWTCGRNKRCDWHTLMVSMGCLINKASANERVSTSLSGESKSWV